MATSAAPASAGLKKNLIIKTTKRRSTFAEQTALASRVAARSLRNDLSPSLKFERRSVQDIKPARRRVRKASGRQLQRVMRCIQRVGVCAPVLIDADGRLIDGHVVVEAAKKMGIDALPCAVIEHLDPADVEFLRIAINRISECGEWDLDELRPALIELRDNGIVLEDTGFSIPELDVIILDDGGSILEQGNSQDEVPDTPADPVTRPGDLWLLNGHRLFCGDATDPRAVRFALGRLKAQAVFTDPPWNIPIKGFVSRKHEDFAMAAGELTDGEFTGFVDAYTGHCAEHLDDGGVMFECIDWRSCALIVDRARLAGLQLINMAIWNKGSGGMGGLYRSAHEQIPIFCKGKTPRVNNVELGRHGRDRTNVWSYPGANHRGSSANKALSDHPTPKPIELVHDAIIDVTNPGEIVFDPFLGSGTTLLAAQKSGRICCAIELDPRYVDVALIRWQSLTGEQAIHEETGLPFEQIRELRRREANEQNAAKGPGNE